MHEKRYVYSARIHQMGIATSQPKKRPVACSSPPRHIHFREAAAYALSGGGLVPLEDLHHVWYEGFSLGDDLLEVIIVGMSSRPIQAASPQIY